MLASAVAPVFNTFPPTAFAQTVGFVAMSGIKSRFVVAAGGGILAARLGLSPVLAAIVGAVPQPVLCIALFGTVAASGIKTLSTVKYDGTANLMIACIVIGSGMGGMSAAIGLRCFGHEVEGYERFQELKPVGAAISVWSNGVRWLNFLGLG